MQTAELFDLRGLAALVTGGGRGLGRHIAVGLAEAGARVFVASRKLASCEETVRRIEAAGGHATALQTDVSRPEEIDALVARVLEETPHLDVLVNNAGVVWAAPLLDYPLEGWDHVFDVNVRGLFWLSRQVARHMRERGHGSIIQVGSISAFRGDTDERQPVVAYMASKGAVASLTLDMAVKLAPHGIRVNSIAPGPFATDMMNHIRHDPQKLSAYEAQIPLGHAGGEDDIKGVAVFLASEASRFVTGQTLVVDGGVSCLYPIQP